MAEQPPLSRIHVVGYSANDRDFPILNLVLDPRVAGYQVPKDLSACPDKRYPNHVFTGAQPISGDQRVRHVWEILPSPYVPFTRYDDDLGPVQGRRRSVKNEGQVAVREADKQVTYEAREGSAIVYTELEETWSIKTDEDGNSLFPIRDRDFYDPSRGPVQERRQLLVPTGEEEGSLENVNGVITQTSYEPYNDFLSVKVVQTYSVDGPLLIGKATDNEGQLVTVTTQRKGAQDYVPPNPTATRTIEVNREDAESIVERIVDTPEVFGAEVYRKTREDLTPQKFKAAQEDSTVEENVEGTADPSITLETGEFAKSEQQVSKFIKRVSLTSRSTTVNPDPLVEKVLTNEGQIGTRTLTLAAGPQSFEPSATLIDANVEALGDGRTVKSETVVENVFGENVNSAEQTINIPERFLAGKNVNVASSVAASTDTTVVASGDIIAQQKQKVSEFKVKTTNTTQSLSTFSTLQGYDYDEAFGVTIPFKEYIATERPSSSIDAEVDPLGDGRFLVKEYESSSFTALDSIKLTSPSRGTITGVPPILKKLEVQWQVSNGTGDSNTSGSGTFSGPTGTIQGSGSGRAVATGAVVPVWITEFEEVNTTNIPTTSYFFFLKYSSTGVITINDVINKIGGGVLEWPVFKPKSYTLVATGQRVRVNFDADFSYNRNYASESVSSSVTTGTGGGEDVDNIVETINIKPCIHGLLTQIKTEKANQSTAIATASVTIQGGSPITIPATGVVGKQRQAEGTVSFTLPATTVANVPRTGTYLIDYRVEPYKFGYARVYAETVNANIFA